VTVLLCVFWNGMAMEMTQWKSHGNGNKTQTWEWELSIGNDSVPKIIKNDTISLLFKTAISVLVSNHNSFLAQFDKIASIYFV